MVTKTCNHVFKERTPLPYIDVRAMNRMNPPYDVYTGVICLGRRLILIMMMMMMMMMMLVMMLVMILMMLSPLIMLVVLAMIMLCGLILLITNILPNPITELTL